MNAEEIAESWQTCTEDLTSRRRWMAALSLVNIACLGTIALYQTGISRCLPDPPLRIFNSKKVTGSAEAYSLLSTPDSALGLSSYSLTLLLTVMGGPHRATEKPWLSIATAGKAMVDLGASATMLSREIFRQRSLCTLCLVANISTAALAILTLKEAKSALNTLSSRPAP